MTALWRRLFPLLVLLGGLAAAAAVASVARRTRAAERTYADVRVARQVAAAVEARALALAQAVRGPVLAFDLRALAPREVSGVLRLAYSQDDAVTAVTLVDRGGVPAAPAAFLPRGGSAGAHPPESLDDLERFAREIPLGAALSQGRALRGPYPSARGEGVRAVVAETVPAAQGTETMVLAAEFDLRALVDASALAPFASEGEVTLVAPTMEVGATRALSDEARALLRAAARAPRSASAGRVLAGSDWHAALVPAPLGLEGVIAVVWRGEDARERRARNGDLALALIVASAMGAVAAALWVVLRDVRSRVSLPAPEAQGPGLEARVLGAVIKELSNPIAATAAAARVLSSEPGAGRVAEAVQRAALRTERAFRRVARLARANEERARTDVDLAAMAQREADALRAEVEHAGLSLGVDAEASGVVVRADAEDLALLVQSLVDAARSVAPARSEIMLRVRPAAGGEGASLTVRDAGALRARERVTLAGVGDGTRTDVAASGLPWELAARIAQDHGARFEARDVEGGVEVRVIFAA